MALARLGARPLFLCGLLFFSVCSAALADVTGVVRGTVTAAGVGSSGVTVTAKGEGVTTRTVTDARGAFTFARLAFGRYVISAHTDAGLDAQGTVEVTSDSVNDLTLVLRAPQTIGQTRVNTHGVPTCFSMQTRRTPDAVSTRRVPTSFTTMRVSPMHFCGRSRA